MSNKRQLTLVDFMSSRSKKTIIDIIKKKLTDFINLKTGF